MSLSKDLKTMCGVHVKNVHCHNAGENEAFEWFCKHKGMGVKFEHTAPCTTQQNGQVKKKIATLFLFLKILYGVHVRQFYYVNAGDNEAFEWFYKHKGMGVKFKYTTPGTPWKMDKWREYLPLYAQT